MAQAPTPRHQHFAGCICVQLYKRLADSGCQVLIAPVDVVLPLAGEADERVDTVVQPDVLVVCDPARIGEKRVRARDLVVEVLSPATAAHDMILKQRIYEQAGVREYWLIHPIDRVLTVYRLEDREFGKPDVQELTGETSVGVLSGVTIQWDALAARLPVVDY